MISLVYCAQTVVAGASAVFSIEIAVQMTDFGANGVGYLDSAFGIGAILGGFVAIGRATARKLATDFGVGVVFWALPLLLVAAIPQAAPAFLAMAVIGFANPIVDVNASTILQRLTPDAVLGRVFGALDTGLIAGMALGSMIMPLLIHAAGLRWALAILGLGIAAGRAAGVPPASAVSTPLLGEPDGLPLLRQIALFSPARAEEARGHRAAARPPRGRRPARWSSARAIRATASTSWSPAVRRRRTTVGCCPRRAPGTRSARSRCCATCPGTATVTADSPTVLLYLERDAFLSAVSGDDEVSTARRRPGARGGSRR